MHVPDTHLPPTPPSARAARTAGPDDDRQRDAAARAGGVAAPAGPDDDRRVGPAARAGRVAVPAGLTAIAAVHAAWALGWRWPGGSDAALAERVVGGTDLPSAEATWAVAAALLAAAGLVRAAGDANAPKVVRTGAWTVAGVLLARGIGGPVADLAGGLQGPYVRLDLMIYSPLCLALGAGAAAVAASAGAPGLLRRRRPATAPPRPAA